MVQPLAPAMAPPPPPPRVDPQAVHRPTLATALDSLNALLAEKRKLRVLVLSSDTGGGHRASANALRAALERAHPGLIHVDIVDFWVDLAAGVFSHFPNQYTFLAKHPWMWKLTYELTRFPPGRAITETYFNTLAHRNIAAAFTRYAPDLILSVHPLVNTLSHHVLRQLEKHSDIPTVPYVTVVTDLGGAHPTWFHKRCDMTYVPSDAVRDTARRVGVPPDRIRELGLPVREDFWSAPPSKQAIRETLGIHPDLQTILAIGGGDGVGGLKAIVSEIATSLPKRLGTRRRAHLVVICGKNRALRDWLQSRNWPIPLTALGFVSNMSDWMAAADVLCTKAGPGTIAEGLIRGLPIIVTGFLPGQEEANVKYVVDNGVGQFANKPAAISALLGSWLDDPAVLADMSARALRIARPNATLQIARDLVAVARAKLQANADELLARKNSALMRPLSAMAPNLHGYVPLARELHEDSSKSHLAVRLQFLLRVAMGSMLMRDALLNRNGRDGGSGSASPMRQGPVAPITDSTDLWSSDGSE